MKLESLSVGQDGRNRVSLKPFASLAGRNQPSTSKFIFGPATWIRYLIKPRPGYAVAYIDFNQQEFAVAAVLSDDRAMQHAYLTADPYLEFAKTGRSSASGMRLRKTHSVVRDLYKTCCLAVMYGMHAKSLALRIGKSEIEGTETSSTSSESIPEILGVVGADRRSYAADRPLRYEFRMVGQA